MVAKSQERLLGRGRRDQRGRQTFISEEQPIASHIRWVPVWGDSGGHGRIVLVARYGGPTTSWLTRAGEELMAAGILDPTLI